MMRSYVQAHLDLLLLAAIRAEPGDGAAVIRHLRERSGGKFAPSSQRVYAALHHLERNRLVERYPEPRRYTLTNSGRRSLEMKRKELDSFVAGVHAVLGQGGAKARPTRAPAASPGSRSPRRG
ncbi:PadR family transcriptional regulator [Pseudonocardia xinjiangensis]|uniref:PadR family transcriptional regulator n=1 Tax=Pseudonocardia xinjiangensis TaxID=75289 RepID=A0ABX1RIR2_9PSEU|nr:helix-turn-helix transcriptional regulator [Pseudonocardia xinjiangensis]NMH80253.1 PadR family transcriptional regulator [Pseudonocardia xinjiangensis]